MVTDFHSVLASWRNHSSQLFNVHEASDVRQRNNTAEPLVPEPSVSDIQMAIENLKRHKSPGTDQIPAELIKAGGRTIHPGSTDVLILSEMSRNFWRSETSQSLYLSIRRVIKQTVVLIEAYYFYQLCTKFYPTSCCQG